MAERVCTAVFAVVSVVCGLFVPQLCFAGEAVTVTGSYVYVLPEDVPEKAGRVYALEHARLEALARAFGTFVSSTTSMSQHEDAAGFAESFNVFSTADVAGVWVRTLDERVERRLEGGDIVLEAYVKGTARKRDVANAEFEAVIGRVDDSMRFVPATEFSDRERFDISFVSPEDGYVAVYASDGVNDACRLLPDASANLSRPVRVERGTTYRFFEESNPVMSLGPDEQSAILRVTVIFQPDNGTRPFVLPVDSSRIDGNGDVLGWSIRNATYQTWLSKLLNERSVQRRDINVSIRK